MFLDESEVSQLSLNLMFGWKICPSKSGWKICIPALSPVVYLKCIYYWPYVNTFWITSSLIFFFLIEFWTLFIYLFIYLFLLRWVFVAACRLSLAAHRLSLAAASGDYSSLRCSGFSLRWLLLLWSMGSRCTGFSSVARGLSSCGARAQLPGGMWDLPGPGLEPASPASAGGFLTTAPPGKSQYFCFFLLLYERLLIVLCLVIFIGTIVYVASSTFWWFVHNIYDNPFLLVL